MKIKVGRRSIRLCDLNNVKLLKKKISTLTAFHRYRFEHFGKYIDELELFAQLQLVNEKIKSYLQPIWKIINELGKKNETILFEGAQGALLDIDFGTYPYVTSSNTTSGQNFCR